MIDPLRNALVRAGLVVGTLCPGACGGAEIPRAEPAPAVVVPPFTVRGRWPDPNELRYRVLPADGPVDADVFRETVERALSVWAETGCVGFARADTEAADLVFRWGRASDPQSPFGRDTSVAATGPLGEGCTVQFDAGRAWQESGGVGPSLFQAAVHETGHALGLGHSEDLAAVLHPQRESGRTALAGSDLAGLHSLYGGGEDGPGDLLIAPAGGHAHEVLLTLRSVAPPGAAEWTLFDTDGDGDEELLIWSTDPAGLGALTVYHFETGPRLERTVGPLLGVGGAGVRLNAHQGEQGERLLDAWWRNGALVRWRFDAQGIPQVVATPAGEALAPGVPRALADLDGNGELERVRRIGE